MKIKQKISSKSKAIIVLSIVATLLLGYAVTGYFLNLPPFGNSRANNGTSPTDQYVNMDKTETEKEAIKSLEENPDQKTQNNQNDTPQQPSNSSNGKKEVNVLLTNTGIFNGKVSASGVVTDAVEQNGTCTYSFTNESNVITKSSSTLTNSTSTTCETVSFPASELSASGTWVVKLTYNSATSQGSSNTKEFTK